MILLWLACAAPDPDPRLTLESFGQGTDRLLRATLEGDTVRDPEGWTWAVDGQPLPSTLPTPQAALLRWSGAPGAHTAAVTARTASGHALTVSVKIEILQGLSPQIALTAPAHLSPGDPLPLRLTLADPDHPPGLLALAWSGDLPPGAHLPAQGAARLTATLSPEADGSLTVTVTDPDGNMASTSISWSFDPDLDADGWPASRDCDDADPARAPGLFEVCDGRDNGCVGAADARALDAPLSFPDDDGDGQGDPARPALACADALTDALDCDDGDPAVYTGAIERCDGIDQDCDGAIDEQTGDLIYWYRDDDGDGYADPDAPITACVAPPGYLPPALATDCDDRDRSARPGAPESCDGADDDCNGTVDDDDALDAPTWYADADGDGYGDPLSPRRACVAPSGHVEDSTDCSDVTAAAWPGAPEYCDGLDNDCEGGTDEPDALDAPTFYADLDGDTFTDPAAPAVACAAPAGYRSPSILPDCDDVDPAVSPVAVELCNGTDDDCDGVTDEPDAADALTWYADADGDTFTDPAAQRTACAAPAGYRAASGTPDCDDGDPAISPVATELCNTVDDDCDALTDEPDAADASTFYADTDADGYGVSALVACALPAGYSATPGDCDDTQPWLHPYDSDLDGLTDGCGWRDLAAGGVHVCALDSDAGWQCQGPSDYGSDTVDLLVESGISIGYLAACGLDAARGIRCWGAAPVPPSGTFASVAVSALHACALDDAGAIACWGDDVYGQSSPPVGVFTEVATADSYSCAVNLEEEILCWGAAIPAASPPDGAFSGLSLGPRHGCALSGGAAVCWGEDLYGETAAPSGLFSWVGAGDGFSCGLEVSGGVQCWGDLASPVGTFSRIGVGLDGGWGLAGGALLGF